MSKNCVIYLVRTSEDDLLSLNKSLALLDDNLLHKTGNMDVILFHEPDFEPYIERVNLLKNGELVFCEIKFPEPPKDAPEIFPHPLPEQIAKGNLGFSMGYRHMCNFFSGAMYDQPIMQNYKYYLRLDTDSYILSKLDYDVFEFMEKGDFKYGFLEPAVQTDHPDVCKDFWEFSGAKDSGLEENRMYYTNWELGEVQWFKNEDYQNFFKRIEAYGGIYTRRWGDAIVKYAGVNMLMAKEHITPIRGMIYQHGHVYDLTK